MCVLSMMVVLNNDQGIKRRKPRHTRGRPRSLLWLVVVLKKKSRSKKEPPPRTRRGVFVVVLRVPLTVPLTSQSHCGCVVVIVCDVWLGCCCCRRCHCGHIDSPPSPHPTRFVDGLFIRKCDILTSCNDISLRFLATLRAGDKRGPRAAFGDPVRHGPPQVRTSQGSRGGETRQTCH